jgi:hypothetical protein
LTDSSGEGATDATAAVTADGVPLDFGCPSALLFEGDTVEATVSAIAERLTAGFSLSTADILVDIEFIFPTGAAGPVDIEMTYDTSVAAGVVGSDLFAFGFANSETVFTDGFIFIADVAILVEWDSDIDGGDGSGIPVSVGLDAPSGERSGSICRFAASLSARPA